MAPQPLAFAAPALVRVRPRSSVCAAGGPRPGVSRRGMLQHAPTAMLGSPRNNQGGDDDKDVSRRAKPESIQADSVVVPAEVSRRELRFCLLEHKLRDAIKEERYEDATMLKRELDSLRARLMKKLRRKINRQVLKMSINQERRLQESPLARAQHALATALDEEDYPAAARALTAVEAERARDQRHSAQVERACKVLDWAWMTSCLGFQMVKTRVREAITHLDRVPRLQHKLRKAVEEDAYERAAELRDALAEETLKRDTESMYKTLKLQVRRRQEELRSISAVEVRRLAYELQRAVESEEYETALTLHHLLRTQELEGALQTLSLQLRAYRDTFTRQPDTLDTLTPHPADPLNSFVTTDNFVHNSSEVYWYGGVGGGGGGNSGWRH